MRIAASSINKKQSPKKIQKPTMKENIAIKEKVSSYIAPKPKTHIPHHNQNILILKN